MVFIGNSSLTKSINKLGDSMVSLAGIFTNIKNSANNIAADITYINGNITETGTCKDAFDTAGSTVVDDMTKYTKSASDGATGIAKVVGSFPKLITNFKDKMEKEGISKKDLVVYIYFFFILFWILSFSGAYFIRNKCLLTIVILFVEIVILAIIIINFFEMFFVVSLYFVKHFKNI
jgi:hypothetical protein